MSTEAFIASPRQFMTDNIILVNAVEHQDDTTKTLRIFKLEALANKRVKKKPGGAVFMLCDANEDETHFGSYWCPYRADNHLGAFLQKEAPYMFTAVMDGCSFGIGSATDDGDRMVYHANRQTTGQEAVEKPTHKKGYQTRLDVQVGAQAEALAGLDVSAGNVISPALYAGKRGKLQEVKAFGGVAYAMKYKSTTVGLRGTQGWTFYTLRYRALSSTEYEHGKLKPFVPGD